MFVRSLRRPSPWNFSELKRKVVLAATLVIISLCSPSARAQSGGTWDFDANSGSQTYFDSTENFVGSTSRDYPELTLRSAASMQAAPPTSTSGTCYAIQDVPVASNGTSTGYVKSKGTMRAVGYWTPPNATATPPATVTVLLTPQSWVTYQPSGANQPLTLRACLHNRKGCFLDGHL